MATSTPLVGGLLSTCVTATAADSKADYSPLVPSEQNGAAALKPRSHDGRSCSTEDPGETNSCLIQEEDIAFLFTSMTWNVDLMEVLLLKAPNPLHSDHQQPQQQEPQVVVKKESEESLTAAAFPSLEEALLTTTTVNGSKGRPAGVSHGRRSKRRKIGRGRATQLRIVPTFYSERVGMEPEDEERCDEEEVEPAVAAVPPCLRPVQDVEEPCGMYLTEEEELDTNYVPHRCLEKGDTNSAAPPMAVPPTENGYPPERSSQGNMRDFLRVFYQSFLLVVSAQVRYQQNVFDRPTRSLSPLEYRALCFLRCHLASFKDILRRHVMCGEKEAERRGAQPLLVGLFRCNNNNNNTNNDVRGEKKNKCSAVEEWLPPHAQLYLAGKEPAYQPLLLEALDVTRVVQCYPEPRKNDSDSTCGAGKAMEVALNALYCWRRLLLERPNGCSDGNTSGASKGDLLFIRSDEWAVAQGLFTRCLSPLVWSPYTAFGPYVVYSATLPQSGRHIVKLVLPAEDRESYDLSAHFQEGVFRFLHGTPLFPVNAGICGLKYDQQQDEAKAMPRRSCLLHCSAGMHRSSGVAIAYLLWLVALSHGKLPRMAMVQEDLSVQEKEGQQQQQQRTTPSYLSAVLRQQQQYKHAADDAAAAAAGEGEEEGGGSACSVNEAKDGADETDSVVQRCAEHVRQQRTVAVPIAAVLQHLRRYASHLRLE
ncbi:hypothetical protein DQ04_00041190 [Trypanosoma grayi]|uniref:hypothetical protein n=1 Tax=Trypanosoma grayi TaxID=71804 RepID=UPI0004F42101|nr:hypothetical protein DQ04_00041190 [Trypanosoma grayi]KEG15555.1 hypothetical protein DQ04_00041190 [Trypanosoma grayi]